MKWFYYSVLFGLILFIFLKCEPSYSQTREYSPLSDVESDFRANMVREAREAHRSHPEPENRLKCTGRVCRAVVEVETTVTVIYETDYGLWTVNYSQ